MRIDRAPTDEVGGSRLQTFAAPQKLGTLGSLPTFAAIAHEINAK
jgi:hypothetical protein